ncbi:MAG TPA: orotate phosphoribosyltransferase [Alphaproteobacteria bacterium]
MPVAAATKQSAAGGARARLADIVRARSLITGRAVTLTSGATSGFYFDMKQTTFDAEGATLIGDLILGALAGTEVDYVAGLEMGALPVVMAVVMQSQARGRPVAGFCVRKEAKGHGTKRLIERDFAAGAKVVVVDDVTTTGGSVLKAAAAVRAAGGVVDTVVTVVDRLEGAAANLAAEGLTLIPLLTARDFDLAA